MDGFRYISAIPVHAASRGATLLGSTGSIGRNACLILETMPELPVRALAAGRNITLLAKQAAHFRPALLVVLEESLIAPLRTLLPSGYYPEIAFGPQGYALAATMPEADVVLSAQVGAAGLAGTVAAVQAGKRVCLANKESLVLAGSLIRAACATSGAAILPVDSEHYALFQCMLGRSPNAIANLVLTASGGPFRGWSAEKLAQVTPADALKHPNWNMGAKITIDSATLMNKGLEVIEACHLYGMPQERVTVRVHPQSVVHSLVEFCDGSLLAQLGEPDMRGPIAGCLAWPRTLVAQVCGIPALDLTRRALTFEEADAALFPCLSLARNAFARGDGSTVVLNAANEVAVERFLRQEISFSGIPVMVEHALNHYAAGACCAPGSVDEVLALDTLTRNFLQK